jgi:hypothetical protein
LNNSFKERVTEMTKRFVACLVLAGASFAFADSRVVVSRSASLDELTASLSQGHGGDALAAVAQERQARLSRLVQKDPGAVLRIALSGDSRATLSPRVREFVEERVELEGALQVLVEDRADGSSRLTFLESDSGERYALYFASEPTRLTTGARVKVTGLKIDQAIAIESGEKDIERVSGVSTASVEATSAISTAFGAQNTAVLMVNFSDKIVQPYTAATVQSVVFTSTSNFDLENSYGQTWLTGDVFGWYTIPLTSTVCDYSTLATQARAAATAAGVNLANYTRHVFAFPDNACGWWGLGTVGGYPSMAWINGSFQLMVVGHEMGHNFGLDHSHSLDCGTVVLGMSCTMSEYGDTLDIMGSSAPYHFNSYSKERLGWLNYGVSPPLTTVSSNGTYTIAPFETLGTASKALKIPRGTTGSNFYVELRRGLGFDASLGSNANISNGVVIHMASPSDPNSSDLLDMTAGTSSWSDPALTVGQTFTDATSGVSIVVNSVSATGATVAVTLSGTPPPPPPPPPACTHVAPVVSLLPSQTAGVAAGTAVNFTLSVTNKDVSPCTASVFALTSTAPSGWTGALTAASLSVDPGATASTTLKVTSPASGTNGSYPVSATAKNQADTTKSASASASYVLTNPITGLTGGTFADNFDRADSTSLGASWTEISGNLVVAGNMLKNALGTITPSLAVVSALNGPVETAEADFTSTDNNLGPRFGIVLRYQDARNYYLIHRRTGGSSLLVISRVVNGVETVLRSSSLANPAKGVAFHIKGRVTGTTLSLDFNGVNKINATDSTFSTGKVGITISNSSSTAQQKADNFATTVQ